MTDRNEALRLADELAGNQLYGLQRRCRDEAAALLRQQAEWIAELEAEVLDQARCNGMGAERELALMAERDRLKIDLHIATDDAAQLLTSTQALRAERDTLRAELETERMRLVACGVVAMANTAESAEKARDMHPDYLCASVRDVAAAVDREMALRAEVERLNPNAERYEWLRAAHWSSSPLCCVLEPKANVRLGATCPSGDQLDTAIATARKAARYDEGDQGQLTPVSCPPTSEST